MPRDLPVGNGELMVAFDDRYQARDLFWPRVGMPNHAQGYPQRLGFWVDGQFAWVDDDEWQRDLRYKPETLATDCLLRHDGLGIAVRCSDVVDYHSPVWFRSFEVEDLTGKMRDARIFIHHDLSIDASPVGDTAYFDPELQGVVHYKDQRWFLVAGEDPLRYGVEHFTTGTKRIGDAEGTWRDAEDGHLSRNPIAQGSVDSTVGFHLHVPAGGVARATVWLACGDSREALVDLHDKIALKTARRMMDRTEAYWRLWALKEPIDFSPLPEPIRDMYVRSQLVLRTQVDNGGAILAANDSDIQTFAGDTYSYMWPRDGALVAYGLALAGQSELSRSFFRFCDDIVEPSGWFRHKYNPNGTLASSWHPEVLDGRQVLAVQQDETALVLWALREHFRIYRDVEFLKPLYNSIVIPCANWLLEHRDHHGLPKPSWDLWEERRGIHTFTVAATIGALKAAAEFARDMGAMDHEERFLAGARRMTDAMLEYLWVPEHERFARMAVPTEQGDYRLDMTVDAANHGIFLFGALPADDPRVVADMKAVRDHLTVKTPIGGVARYQRDYYHRIEHQDLERVPGNPWIICTLWVALHDIETATTMDELNQVLEVFDWVGQRARPSGVLPEQVHPHNGDPVSVSPLTWSHAVVVTTVLRWLLKHAELSGKPSGVVAGLARQDELR